MKKVILITIFFLTLVAGVKAANLDTNVEVEVSPTTTVTVTTTPTVTPTVTLTPSTTTVPLNPPTITFVDVVVVNSLRRLTIIGSNYQVGATVRINSVTYTPVFLDSSHLQLSLSNLASGVVNVRVTNPDTQYADYSFNYQNPTPTRTATPTVTPSVTTTPVIILPKILQIDYRPNLNEEAEIMIIGSNFQNGAVVSINGIGQTVTFIDAEHLLLTNLKDGLYGNLLFEVINPDGGADEMMYAIAKPIVTPTVTADVEQTLIEIFTVNKEADTLLVTGKNFEKGMKSYINGVEYEHEYIDSNHIRILGIRGLSGNLKVRLVNKNGDSAEKNYLITTEGLAESPAIVKVLRQVAEEAQVENVAISGLTTAVAVSSLADYLKLAFIPWKKRKKYWGLVLDNTSFIAIPLAIINAVDLKTKKIVATAVSDMEGRYGLILDSGEYHLEVKHYEYTLATQSQVGVYYGQNITVTKETQLSLNILMTRTGHAQEPLTNKFKKVWNYIMVKFTKIYPYILAVFLLLNIYFLLVTGQLIYIFLVVYHLMLVVVFFSVLGKYKHQWATCVDSLNGNFVPRALIKLYQIENNELVDTKVADAKGRFSFIVPKGSYQLIASAMGYSFPSVKNKASQDQQGRFIIEFNNALNINEIPFDSIQGAQLLSANKFGVIN